MFQNLIIGISVSALVVLLSPMRRSARTLAIQNEARPTFNFALSRRKSKASDGDIRVLISQVASLLRSGAPPGAAWRRAAGVRVDEIGVPDPNALAPIFGAGPAVTMAAATKLALSLGAPLAVVLNSVGNSLTAESEAAAERKAIMAGPQTTARVLLALPLLGMAIGWLLGADPITTTFSGGLGTVSVILGFTLMLIGRAWTNTLIKTAQKAGDP